MTAETATEVGANAQGSVPAITRGMAILELVAAAGQAGASVPELAKSMNLAKSSTANICAALEGEGMLRRSDGRLTLGRRILSLAGDYLRSADQLAEFYALCRRSRLISREAARLALLDGTDVLYLARYEGTNPIRLTANIGDRFPAHVTATGKAVLATLPEAVVEDRYRGKTFVPFTAKSLTSLPELMAELHSSRQRGYFMDDEETNIGVVCFAVPVVNLPGEPAQFAISATLLKARADELDHGEIVSELQQIARALANPLSAQSL
ncbi:IclR family transcriptional regulator [Arthrobacter sp. S39]|uniref:IclR family transcriptional regulator n=1 Tax=Arthrobacter sp. S39 TaxID=2509720 RepID=UPI001A947B2B|nr:IclR family transcriptional regulator [Arthrobacter sp. S39]